MSFESREWSLEDGQPIYLYKFTLNEKNWYYTSADADVQLGVDAAGAAILWVAVPISDDGISQTGESSSDALTVTTVTTIPPAQIYMDYPPARNITLSIFETHEGDLEMRAIYVGEITQTNVPQPGTMVFTVEMLQALLSREGLRLSWQRACPYALYDPVTCKVNKAQWNIGANVVEIVDNLLKMDDIPLPSGRLNGGFVEWTDPVRGIERRGIEEHSDNLVRMFGTADGITVGLRLTMYPGCPRTTEGCTSFNNLDNYGGAPALQGKSPFDGSTVFY